MTTSEQERTDEQLAGLRERKKAETRRAIRAAALELADRDGLEHLTVAMISDAAGVSQRTFFNYFSCKEEALVAENLEVADRMREQVLARPASEGPLHALRAAFTEGPLLDLGEDQRATVRAHHRLVHTHPELLPRQMSKYENYERALREAIAERLGVDSEGDPRPGLLAALATTIVRVSIHRWTTDDSRTLREHVTETFDLMERGL